MPNISLNTSIEDIIALQPSSAAVFEKMGIDYCCGGKATLQSASISRGLNPDAVLKIITGQTDSSSPQARENWAEDMSPSELVEHIEKVHHAKLWDELDRLDALTTKVAKVHGPADGRLAQVCDIFLDLERELSDHMRKEEQVLFPLIRQIEDSQEPVNSHCGSISNPIRQMDADHDQADIAFLKIRNLTDNYTPPAHACYSYRAMLTGLEQMENDLRVHMHQETNVLFPKIIKLEAAKYSKLEV
jgi:regulator of cell morphogenesis and NO signaling